MTLDSKNYEVGGTYQTEDIKSDFLWKFNSKFSFFYNVIDCFEYLPPFPDKVTICEIDVLGDIVEIGGYHCTNEFKILRKLSGNQILEISNDGEGNKGIGNIGNQNDGNYNRGNKNQGHFNQGNYNKGTGNEGNENEGNFNIGNNNIGTGNIGSINFGDDNIGIDNRGNRNVGNHNTGNYNKGDYCLGDFNTQSIGCSSLFNNPVPNSVIKKFRKSRVYTLLDNLGGFNNSDKKYSTNDLYKFWWELLSEDEKKEFKSLDYFNSLVFQKITGIWV